MIVNTAQGGDGSYGTLSEQVSNFAAITGNEQVSLSWTNPSSKIFSGVLIVRKTDAFPAKPYDGLKIYCGTGTVFTDTGLTNGTQYYYRAFAYNAKKEYQTIYCVATATPLAGQPLGSMPIGTKLKFGSIYGNPIVQTIADISGNDVTLITDKTIGCGVFDASEDSYPRGYAKYASSNINQWLNSDANAGEWFTPQHTGDVAPANIYGFPEYYGSSAGFLNQFSSKEKGCLKVQTFTVGKMVSGGGSDTQTINVRVRLPSGTELGFINEGLTDGSKLALFTDNASRVTGRAANVPVGCPGYNNYWTRSVYDTEVYIVKYDGTSSVATWANDTDVDIRPCCCLDASILISVVTDSDGCYTLM